MKELLSKYKVTLSITSVLSLVGFGYLTNSYLQNNLFEPIKSIENKLDKSEYEKDKKDKELRDSIRHANREYLRMKENELINKYSSTKTDTIHGGGN